MTMNPLLAATSAPPVMEARRWLEGVTFPPDRPLINVSQAAPAEQPPKALRRAIAEYAMNEPQAHLYGPVLGLPELRAQVASDWSDAYGGALRDTQVAITAGCNQAFCAAVTTLAGKGDEIILPTPWYFNHKMYLDMMGIAAVALKTGAQLLPDPDSAAKLITPATKAIVLVTPNNPGGVEYPAKLVRAFYQLCQSHGIALIIDETYRDFHSRTDAPHDLFADPDWDQTLIQLYSFSKAYRLTGHRVGALLASETRLAQVEKYLDTTAICTNQLGQMAALWGMRNLRPWLAAERTEILTRRAAIESAMPRLPDWELKGCGAYFAYVTYPYEIASDVMAKRLVAEAGILLLPGTMFMPSDDPAALNQLRIAFANIDTAGIDTLFTRLTQFTP